MTGPNTGGKTVALEDGRPAGGHGPVRLARPGRRGLAVPGLRRRARRHRRRAEPRAVALDLLVARPADQRDPGQGDGALAGPARRAGGRHRPGRRRGPGPGDPRRARPHRLPRDRDDPHRRPEDLRVLEPRCRERRRRVRRRDAPSRSIGCIIGDIGQSKCAQDRAAVAAARARGRPGGGVPGPEPGRRSPRLGGPPAAAQGGREAREAALEAQAEAERTREALARAARRVARRSRNKADTIAGRHVLDSSRATGWSSRGSATTARAGWSSSTPARRRPSSRSGMSPGTSRSTS